MYKNALIPMTTTAAATAHNFFFIVTVFTPIRV